MTRGKGNLPLATKFSLQCPVERENQLLEVVFWSSYCGMWAATCASSHILILSIKRQSACPACTKPWILSASPLHKLGMVVHTFNPRMKEIEEGRSEVQVSCNQFKISLCYIRLSQEKSIKVTLETWGRSRIGYMCYTVQPSWSFQSLCSVKSWETHFNHNKILGF